MSLAYLAIRSISQRRLRSLLTVTGIAIGTALILAVAITNISITASFVDVVSNLSGAADLQVENVSAGPFDSKIIEEVDSAGGVEQAAPVITRSTTIDRKNNDYLRILGIDRDRERGLRKYTLKAGSFLRKRAGEIILVDDWAAQRNIKVNDNIDLLGTFGPTSFRVVGMTAKVGPGAADNGAVAFITLRDAERLFDLKGRITQIDVRVSPDVETAEVKKELKERLGAGFTVERPADKGASIEAVTRGIMGAFASFGSLALFIGAFVVFNTMMMNVAEEMRDISALRLLGAGRRQILSVILIESGIFGVVGSALGLLLGRVLAGGLAAQVALIYHITLTKTAVPLNWAIVAFTAGVAASLIAGIIPALKAGAVTPIQTIRLRATGGDGRVDRYGWAAGLLFAAAGIALFLSPLKNTYGTLVFSAAAALFFLGAAFLSVSIVTILNRVLAPVLRFIFGNEGRLATDSVARGKTRTALAVVTLLVSLAMVVAAGELSLADRAFLNNWTDAVLPFDLSARTPLPMSITEINRYRPVDPALRSRIEKVRGIDRVTPIKFLVAEGLGRSLFIIAVKGKDWRHTSDLKFDEGDRDRALASFDKGGSAIISSTLADKNNVHLGDKIRIKTPTGRRSLDVTGIFPEIANDGYVIYVSNHDQIKYWQDASVDGFNMTIDGGARLEDVKRRLERELSDVKLAVISGADIRAEISRSVDQFLSIMTALVLVATVVTALGIVNTLAMSVVDRIGEIGLLRSLGSSRLQMGKMIVAEASLIGTIGAILGTVVGLVISWELVIISHLVGGWKVPYVFPWRYLLIAAALSLVVSILSSIYPARKAARIEIIKAISWE